MIMRQDLIALDRSSGNRTVDADGHMKIKTTPISKAMVCPYYGKEIPHWEELNLVADRIYNLLRDPLELAKGSASFNGKPLVIVHRSQFADDHDREIVVGQAGHNCRFETPYLTIDDMTIWDAEGINGIESGEQRQLSASYRYEPDMTPGEFNGKSYDGVMRDIICNHVALVDKGRAGPDVLVADAELKINRSHEKPNPFLPVRRNPFSHPNPFARVNPFTD